jgi:hypothetical protein
MRTIFALLPAFLLTARILLAADVSGDWEFAGDYLKDANYARVHLKAEDGKITGNLNELALEGTFKDDELKFSAKRPNGEHFGDFTGRVRSDGLEGTAVWSGDRKVTWTARRAAQVPATPQTHDFEPREFHRVFSDALPPVREVEPHSPQPGFGSIG